MQASRIQRCRGATTKAQCAGQTVGSGRNGQGHYIRSGAIRAFNIYFWGNLHLHSDFNYRIIKMLFQGYETVSSALTFALYELARQHLEQVNFHHTHFCLRNFK